MCSCIKNAMRSELNFPSRSDSFTSVVRIAFSLALFITAQGHAQTHIMGLPQPANHGCDIKGKYIPGGANTKVMGPTFMYQLSLQPSNGLISYNFSEDFPTEYMPALEFAADLIEVYVNLTEPIVIDCEAPDFGELTWLASCGTSKLHYGDFVTPGTNVWYAQALAKHVSSEPLNNPAEVDMNMNVNTDKPWYLGTDGNCPSDQFDLVSVALHEIMHGLGFSGGASNPETTEDGLLVDSLDFPEIYDYFVVNNLAQPVMSLDPIDMAQADLSGAWFWGENMSNANNGFPAKLFTPSSWSASSYVHFDESTYVTGSSNSLMTPNISNSEVTHAPGPLVLALLADIGYSVNFIVGCTDNTACNFDPQATVDDGSCTNDVGCTDALACNYVATACHDDALCEYAQHVFVPFPGEGLPAVVSCEEDATAPEGYYELANIACFQQLSTGPLAIVEYIWTEDNLSEYGECACGISLEDNQPPSLDLSNALFDEPLAVTCTYLAEENVSSVEEVIELAVEAIAQSIVVVDECPESVAMNYAYEWTPWCGEFAGSANLFLDFIDIYGEVGSWNGQFTIYDPTPPVLTLPESVVFVDETPPFDEFGTASDFFQQNWPDWVESTFFATNLMSVADDCTDFGAPDSSPEIGSDEAPFTWDGYVLEEFLEYSEDDPQTYYVTKLMILATDDCGNTSGITAFVKEALDEDSNCGWWLPIEGVLGPALLQCESPGEHYTLATSQSCAQSVISNDAFCVDNQWDNVCQSAYVTCMETCTDVDEDGICDLDDVCVGAYDACGICNGPGAVYECGCADLPDGDCACGGIQLDALGNCGGGCDSDANNNGVCDSLEGCTQENACNYNASAIVDDGSCAPESCECPTSVSVDFEGIYALGGPVAQLDVLAGGILLSVDVEVHWNEGTTAQPIDLMLGLSNENGAGLQVIPENAPGIDFDFVTLGSFPESWISSEDGLYAASFDVSALGITSTGLWTAEFYWSGAGPLAPEASEATVTLVAACLNTLCETDADNDGVCDDVDDCVGTYDACGECNGPGATLECGCSIMPFGDCDCDGNQLDALGVCGGECDADTNGNGTCDSAEQGCTDGTACNFDSSAVFDDGTCVFDGPLCPCALEWDFDASALGAGQTLETTLPHSLDNLLGLEISFEFFSELAPYGNFASDLVVGICDPNGNCVQIGGYDLDLGYAVAGAFPSSWNSGENGLYTASIALDAPGLQGTGDWTLTLMNGWSSPSSLADWVGSLSVLGTCGEPAPCDADTDGDGVCDDQEIAGCTNSEAINFNPEATDDDGSCDLGAPDLPGCTDESATNYNPEATVNDGSCQYGNDDYYGCTDPFACNFNSNSVQDDGSCDYLSCIEVCDNTWTFETGELSGGQFGSQEIVAVSETGLQTLDVNVTFVANNGGYYASDVLLAICDPSGNCLQVGGYFMDLGYQNMGNWPSTWSTSALGNYTATVDVSSAGLTGAGVWTVTVYNGYASGGALTAEWAGVVVADGVCAFPVGVSGCTDTGACNYDAQATTEDGSCQYPQSGLDCNGNCLVDEDSDGICDDVDECVGALDACGVCNGPGEIYECGCSDIPAGDCDCQGNQLDALGVCGGNCAFDEDQNGVCDDSEILGCTDSQAFNFNPSATIDDGTCEYTISGCTDWYACNYNPDAFDDDGSCEYPFDYYDCDGNCVNDIDNDGICDEFDDSIFNDPGCTDSDACNFDVNAAYDDGSCEYPAVDYLDCDGNCNSDIDNDGICDEFDDCLGTYDACGICDGPGEIYECGCTDVPEGDCDCQGNQLDALGVCGGDCAADEDGDGICDDVDECVGALDACGVCNGPGEIYECGCDDVPEGNCDCLGNQLDALGVCGGDCAADLDGNGVCDDSEIPGCTYAQACNYNPDATADDGSCSFPSGVLDCEGACLHDEDGDGVCDEFEFPGCTQEAAINFNAFATEDDGSCLFPGEGGCTYEAACNFEPWAEDDDGSCLFPALGMDCDGNSLGGDMCLGDLNESGLVETSDLLMLLSVFGEACD